MTNSYELALRVGVGIVVALAFVWTTLVIALVLLRPKGGLLREAMRVLPDTIRLLRRLATDRSIGVGVRVRLWLLFAYLAIPVDLIPDCVPVLGYADDAIIIAAGSRALFRFAGNVISGVDQAHPAKSHKHTAAVQRNSDGDALVTVATRKPKLPIPLRRSKDSQSANI